MNKQTIKTACLTTVLAVSTLAFLGPVRGAENLPIKSKARPDFQWSGSWGASPVFPVGQEINNQTIRSYLRVSRGGKFIRLRFSNETGKEPLTIGACHVALALPEAARKIETNRGAIDPASDRKVTFNDAESVTIPPGAPILSDAIELDVDDLAKIAVSVYVPRWSGLSVVHPSSQDENIVSVSGDFTAATKVEGASSKSRFFLTAVEVADNTPARSIVAFGDSITDGYGSTVGADKRWPDFLAAKLKDVGVVNAGISGNRLLHDLPANMFGPCALSRFDRDAISVPGVTDIVLLEGINDIGQATSFNLPEQKVTLVQIKAAYKQLVDRAHARGIKVSAGTLLPFEGTVFAGYYSEENEALRQKVNDWLKRSSVFDHIIDFDAAVRDPAHPSKLRAGYDCGDHLHPNDAGYKAMADAIDLKIFD